LCDSGQWSREDKFINLLRFLSLVSKVKVSLELDHYREELRRNCDNFEDLVTGRVKEMRFLRDVLLSIRDVDQRIVCEKRRDRLLRAACEILISSRGFQGVWIVVTDTSSSDLEHACIGFDEALFEGVIERFRKGNLPVCCLRSRTEGGVVVTDAPAVGCGDCPLAHTHGKNAAMTVRLWSNDREHGWMGISVPARSASDPEEALLLARIAGDIVFALHDTGVALQRDRFAKIVASSSQAMALIGRRYTYLEANPSYCRLVTRESTVLTGRKLEDVLGKTIFEEAVRPRLERCFAGEEARFETAIQVSGAAPRFVDGLYTPCLDADGTVSAVAVCFHDITENKEAEKALREAYDIINKSSSVAFTWKNQEGWPVAFVSENVVRLFGYTAEEFMSGKVNYAACIHPEDLKRVVEEATQVAGVKETRDFEHKPYRILTKEGSEKMVRNRTFVVRDREGRATHYKGMVEDISERVQAKKEKQRLESLLRRAQRMEAISTLAGGIAHDFNNILAAVMGYAQLAQMKLDRESEVYADLKEVVQSANRAKLLIRQILAVGRSQEQEKHSIQLKYIVKEVLGFLRSTLPSTIEVREKCDSDAGIIDADPTQMHQVIMNLCTNAAHAMEEGGVLEVNLGNAEFGTRNAELNLEPGRYLRLTVNDTGCGMGPDVLEKIFVPYFTTKNKGMGTGLGLSVVHSIVSRHGGAIAAESEPGKGSRFRVYLPLIQTEEDRPQVERETPMPTGKERILLIDDEAVLADMAKKMLQGLGYGVTSMTSSIEALALFREDPKKFDLVISDTTMPHMPGDTLSEKMMTIRPDMPIIICTGHSERMSENRAKEMGIKGFLMKPVKMEDLAETVRSVLGPKSHD
jgi:PAS domain S-box-containing protein